MTIKLFPLQMIYFEHRMKLQPVENIPYALILIRGKISL